MKKLLIWFKIFLITAILAAPVSYAVLFKERIRKNTIIDKEEVYFLGIQSDLTKFKSSQEQLIEQQKQKNKQDMESAKLSYDSLLAQQAALIKQNSQYVQSGQTTNTTVSSNTGTTSKPKTTTTTSKPKTTTKTKTS
jgi:hypothetical protein